MHKNRHIFRLVLPMILCFLQFAGGIRAEAQEKIGSSLEIDRTVHNFGDIILGNGPVSCTFTVRNTGDKPAVIYNVISSCGCTDVSWTREPIRPGASGQISATYSNDEGPYPFDKSLTVYFSDVRKPVVLKLRGVSLAKKVPIEELYTVRYGAFGLKDSKIKCGNIEQGGQRSDAVTVANVSDKPIDVQFADVTNNLQINISPNPIPPKGTAEMTFTVTASRDRWGKNWYYATPVVDGKSYRNSDGSSRIGIWAFTKENFNGLTDDMKAKGARPMFNESTYSFGKIKRGETVHAEFTFKNQGQERFRIYKVDVNAPKYSHSTIPAAAPGEEVTFRVHLDTEYLPAGETLAIVTLTTNSPLRPIVNLFIAGWLE